MSGLLNKLYLFSYNSLQAIGWAFSLFKILSNLISTRSVSGTYASAGELICFLQCLAFLEVIHGALGLVPSGVLYPLMQWGGRTHFLLAIVRGIDEVQELPSVFITFIAWCLSELHLFRVLKSHSTLIPLLSLFAVIRLLKLFTLLQFAYPTVIRYTHYAINCFGRPPFWITYLRYNAFIILYPIGVGPGEIWLMYQALPFIKGKNLYAYFFFRLPFSYYRFVVILLIFYPLLWLKLYLHMFKQRSSKLGKQQNKKKKI